MRLTIVALVLLSLALGGCASTATEATATATSGDAGAGPALAAQFGCAGCHSVDGSAGVAPTWKGLYGSSVKLADGSTVTADSAYIDQSILEPDAKVVEGFKPGIMRSFSGKLSEQQIADIIAYVQTLK
jgi:cytochrome c oxidase subunit II